MVWKYNRIAKTQAAAAACTLGCMLVLIKHVVDPDNHAGNSVSTISDRNQGKVSAATPNNPNK